jgi:hypothetical protein
MIPSVRQFWFMTVQSFHNTSYWVALFRLHGWNLPRRMCSVLWRDTSNSSKDRFYYVRIDFRERRKINTWIIHEEKRINDRTLSLSLSLSFPSPIKYWLKCLFNKLFVAACPDDHTDYVEKSWSRSRCLRKKWLQASSIDDFHEFILGSQFVNASRARYIVKPEIDRIEIVPLRLRTKFEFFFYSNDRVVGGFARFQLLWPSSHDSRRSICNSIELSITKDIGCNSCVFIN